MNKIGQIDEKLIRKNMTAMLSNDQFARSKSSKKSAECLNPKMAQMLSGQLNSIVDTAKKNRQNPVHGSDYRSGKYYRLKTI